jgi:hypothetical protein
MRHLPTGTVAICAALLWAAPTARAANTSASTRRYYYLVTRHDRSVELKELTAREGAKLSKAVKEEYAAAAKEWAGRRASWGKAMPAASFPVPGPMTPRVQRQGVVPANDRQRKQAEARYRRRLDIWDVYVIRDAAGTRTAEALRRDKLPGRQTELLKVYAKAATQWAAANKGKSIAEAAKTDKTVPRKPVFAPLKRGVNSRKLADRYVERATKKLESEKKPEPPEAKPEPEPEPGQPKVQDPNDRGIDL